MAILQPWNIVFLIGFVVYVCIRGRFARQTKDNQKVIRQVDALERILLIGVLVTSLLLPLLYLFTPLLWFANYGRPLWVQTFGAVVMGLSLWLFWRSHRDLGLNWSVTLEIRSGHQLVTDGIYRWIRHPMYAAITLFCVAQAMLLANWLAGWGALVAFACLYVIRTPREERMMLQHFGDQYLAYQRRTGRLVPRLFGS